MCGMLVKYLMSRRGSEHRQRGGWSGGAADRSTGIGGRRKDVGEATRGLRETKSVGGDRARRGEEGVGMSGGRGKGEGENECVSL